MKHAQQPQHSFPALQKVLPAIALITLLALTCTVSRVSSASSQLPLRLAPIQTANETISEDEGYMNMLEEPAARKTVVCIGDSITY